MAVPLKMPYKAPPTQPKVAPEVPQPHRWANAWDLAFASKDQGPQGREVGQKD